MKTDALVEQLKWRYAVKKFDPSRKIPAEQWQALESALVLSPSSFGLQPWRFIVVSDSAVRKQLRAVSWNQAQVVEASHLVVFAIKKDLNAADVERFVRRIAQVRGVSAESLSSYEQMMLDFVAQAGKGLDINAWSAQQLYIAMGVFMTAAAVLGIDTCPMEGIEPDSYDKILGLGSQGFHTLAAAAAGYRAADDKSARLAKVRYETSEVITHVGRS
ncbi:MAG: NAD(P)H-dependent oxidoreductase [Candidatus Omnitrophota bacterium]|nr:NAD(P)H-dependent oxidoreductase [Candidatus Omnitrophota bacterium]